VSTLPDKDAPTRRAVTDILNALAESADSVVERKLAKCLVRVQLSHPEQYSPTLNLRETIAHADKPVVLACLKLLVALGEGIKETEAWVNRYQPSGPKQHRNMKLTGLRMNDPDAWADKIASTMRECNGNTESAAFMLKIGRRTLCRWLTSPEVQKRMNQ
jgi:DNA-binding NtrC family response regulator